jgi:hypothetical protein
MTRLRLPPLLVLLCLMLNACASGDRSSLDSSQRARQFVEALYSRYSTGTSPSPLESPSETFAPALARLIMDDRQKAAGELGALDHDPFCACQDFVNFKVRSIEIVLHESLKAQATVSFLNSDRPQKVTLQLERVDDAAAWRVGDVEEPEIGSLRSFLERELHRE